MRHKKYYLSLIALFTIGSSAIAQDYFDDIYYNPKKDVSSKVIAQKKKESYYIPNMGDMDVDAYNRRGSQYYVSQIDTIGTAIENGEDFVYTQQIQKYYNPTIVVENANSLGDILSNAYGNVDIIINNNGYPVFGPYYGWNYPYYASVWSPWSWGFNFGPFSWSIGWYDPWYSWNWGWRPSWSWGPSWGWSPGPGWGAPPHRPGWGPGPGPAPMATWSPHGNRTVGPRPGWSAPSPIPNRGGIAMHRPSGGNYGGSNQIAPGNTRPGNMQGQSRPTGVVNNNGKWEYNTSGSTGHRVSGTGVLPGKNNQTGVSNTRGNSTPSRNTGTVTNSTNRNNTTHRSSNYTPSRNTGSFGSGGRSTGGRNVGGGGSRSGGGGRHR